MRGANAPLRFDAATMIAHLTPAISLPIKKGKMKKVKGKSGEGKPNSIKLVSAFLLPFYFCLLPYYFCLLQ
jgi:ABC-type ATPase involved in cell division